MPRVVCYTFAVDSQRAVSMGRCHTSECPVRRQSVRRDSNAGWTTCFTAVCCIIRSARVAAVRNGIAISQWSTVYSYASCGVGLAVSLMIMPDGDIVMAITLYDNMSGTPDGPRVCYEIHDWLAVLPSKQEA